MRSDMAKVIVERPRTYRGSRSRRSVGMPRRTRDRQECLPLIEAMGRGYREKHLNENLAPLLRWLHKQVGRLWSEVYREIAAQLSVTSAVQKHVLDHVKEFVCLSTFRDRDGLLCDRVARGMSVPLRTHKHQGALYVCARTGVLMCAPNTDLGEMRFRQVAPGQYLMRRQGLWYWVATQPLPAAEHRAGIVDAYTGFSIHSHAFHAAVMYRPPAWGRNAYASSMHQLSKRELRYFMEASGASVPVKVKR
jgi:hypothetical protein